MATEIIEIIDFSDCSSPLLSISDNNTPGPRRNLNEILMSNARTPFTPTEIVLCDWHGATCETQLLLLLLNEFFLVLQ
jgi:hypothetical protein